jgi:hypothetical protein
MQSEGVIITIVSTVVTTVVAAVVATIIVVAVAIAAAVTAFESLLLGHLIFRRPPTSSGCDRRSSRYPHNP